MVDEVELGGSSNTKDIIVSSNIVHGATVSEYFSLLCNLQTADAPKMAITVGVSTNDEVTARAEESRERIEVIHIR